MTRYTWQLLRAGSFRLDGGGMFGVVPKPLWSRLTEPDAQNRIGLQTNCLFLDDGSTRILVESGFGGKWSDKERGFYDLQRRTVVDALAEVGVEPGDIDHVVVTHLHFDHAAGLTRLDGDEAVPVFPNATVHVQRREWDDARANRSTMNRTYLESHLAPIADRVRLADGAAEILPGIHVEPVPGHTWGQQAVRFTDDAGTVCFPGDVLPTIHHAPLPFSMAYDMEPYTNLHTKKSLLQRAAAEDWRLALDHEPGEAIVQVVSDVDRPGRHSLVALS